MREAGAAPAPREAAKSRRVPPTLVGAVLSGTLLNPLNSSMIAVALVPLGRAFHVDVGSAAWLISGFYLAASVGQPLMGRLADEFGPKRIFLAGLAIVAVTGAAAPFSPGFWWLVADRTVQALGTSAAFPAGLAMIRGVTRTATPPASTLGVLSIGASVSAGFGPTIAGFLVAASGWQSVFLVNVPVVAVAFGAAAAWLPKDTSKIAGAGDALRRADVPGVLLFALTVTSLLAFLLSLRELRMAPLVAVSLAAALVLWWRERRASEPFLDVRMLAANGRLISVFAQFALVNVIFYSVFFGLPLWYQEARGFNPDLAGLLILPISGLGVALTPLAAVLIRRGGVRTPLLVGAVVFVAGSLGLLLIGGRQPAPVLAALTALLGVPNAFNNLGLQAALYEVAPREAIGAAAGQFQTFRYVGAILSTSLLGMVFPHGATTTGLHELGVVLACLSVVLVIATLVSPASRRERSGTPSGSAAT